MKESPDPEAFQRFKEVMRQVVQVPRSTIKKQVEEHRERAAKNPNKRGPKPKGKRSR